MKNLAVIHDFRMVGCVYTTDMHTDFSFTNGPAPGALLQILDKHSTYLTKYIFAIWDFHECRFVCEIHKNKVPPELAPVQYSEYSLIHKSLYLPLKIIFLNKFKCMSVVHT